MAMGSGLQAPTRAESRRMDLIAQAGCVACWLFAHLGTPCEVHHLTIGGKHGAPRRGHAFTVGLCPWHHRGVRALRLPGAFQRQPTAAELLELVGPSYALSPLPFRGAFGGDDALLRAQSELIRAVAASYVIHPGRYADPVMPGGFAP